MWETFKNKLKSILIPKLVLTFHCWINCSSDLKTFVNSRPSDPNVKKFSRSLEKFCLTLGQNNIGNKIPFPFASNLYIRRSFTWFSDLKVDIAEYKISNSSEHYFPFQPQYPEFNFKDDRRLKAKQIRTANWIGELTDNFHSTDKAK